MASERDFILDIRISDVSVFMTVKRYGSLSAAARELNVTTSSISKCITRLEAQVNQRLLTRTSRGVSLSEAALKIAPRFEAALTQLRSIRQIEHSTETVVSLAAPLFLLEALVAPLLEAMPELRVRALQMETSVMSSMATDNVFDVALTTQESQFSSSWSTSRVGDLSSALFGHPKLAQKLASTRLTPERLRSLPFVSPIQPMNSRLPAIDDSCPLYTSERLLGHEVQTMGIGLRLASVSEQVVFGPRIAARDFVLAGKVVEIPVEGWNVSEPVFMVVNIDRVASKLARRLAEVIRAELE
jgi:DNA-binding transcriptional LysR family regulator